MRKNLTQKLSFQLFLWGLMLVPFAYVADAVLDAVLYAEGSIHQLLLFPSHHELASRVLFSIFILAAIYLGMHYLANIAQKERSLLQKNQDLSRAREDTEELVEQMLQQLRNTSSELETSIELLKAQCSQTHEKTRFFINGVGKAGNRLHEQLEISLALANRTFGDPQRERVKLDELAFDIAEELRNKHPEREIEFKIQPWINGWCDRKMLRFIIGNLFRSAIDFIPDTGKGLIEFGMFRRNEQKVFFVRHNGDGYSDAQALRLFDPFRNNSHDTSLPKDTVRLAKARRAVIRHGGHIWAEGIESVGGTIFFTLYTP